MPSIIPVNSKYCLQIDTYSWSVCYWKKRKKQKNGGSWEGISWHSTLQQAVEWLVKRLVSESDLVGTEEVVNALTLSTLLITTAINDSCLSNSWVNHKAAIKNSIS